MEAKKKMSSALTGMEAKKKMLPAFVSIVIITIFLYFLMIRFEGKFLENPKLFSYVDWFTQVPTNPLYKVFWIIGDFTEAVVYKSLIASIALIIGSIIAHNLCRKKPELKIYPISFGAGLLPWILVGATVGLTVSSLLYADTVGTAGWLPTFLPGCTIPAALVVMYGGGWKTSLSGGILSGIIQYPLAQIGVDISAKLNLPGFTFVTIIGMCIGGIIIVEIFRLLPWNRGLVKGTVKPKVKPYENKEPVLPEPNMGWMLRRAVTDLTELSFLGSEIVGVFIIAGAFLSWFLNPAHICYAAPIMFPAIFTTQILCGSLCAFVYYDKWAEFGFFPSFSALIGASVCVMQYGTSLPIIIIAVLLNTFITAPIVNIGFGYMAKNVKRYPVMCGVVVCMGVCIGIISEIIMLILRSGILA